MARFATLFGVTAWLADAAVAVRDVSNDGSRFQLDAQLSAVASADAAATLTALTESIFNLEQHEIPKVSQAAMNSIASSMDVKTAVQTMESEKLPDEVSNLVQKVGNNGFKEQFSEESLAKARRALNSLIEKAWVELDDKIFKCKGFEDMNRQNYGQVIRDIARLVEQIGDLERQEAEAIAGIAELTDRINDVEELLKKERMLYNKEYAQNKAELTIRQNDLDVFQFILVFTQCKDATSLTQSDMRVCQTGSGRKTILFKDGKAAGKYKKLLTPSTKRKIDEILKTVEGSAFLQFAPNNNTTPPPMVKEPVVGEDGKPCIAATGQVKGNAADEAGDLKNDAAQEDGTPGTGFGDEDECMKSCSPTPPDCGLLHDKLSLMWGEFKDQVDELTMIMRKNEYEWMILQMNLNRQIKQLVGQRTKLTMLLAEVRSNLAADRQELKEKQKQKRVLDKQYWAYMDKCFKRIQWIMYQDMCAIKVVRNAVLENSTVCNPEKFQDCDVANWQKGKCSVPCDDKCDSNKPFECGGWMTMTREIIAEEDDCGIKCPATSKQIRCGQYKCPVDCMMSDWSGFGACSAECEGGVKSQTRSVLIKPKNGGKSCDSPEESIPCNSFTCDRDCTLNKWTEWTPCSVACGGGFQEKKKHILIPTRGEGRCPKEMSGMRYDRRMCNTQKCVGDEICIAHQDLIVALDGSGSVRDSGFKILKDYTKKLLSRYQSMFFGDPAMKIGLVQFGNGRIMTDEKTGKTFVSPARSEHPLSDDIDSVITKVDGLPFKKGFTNMAQAFQMAENMFILGSRKSAQQSVLTITDGKPSFAWMTNEMVEQLDDKNIMRYFVVVNNQGPTSDVMKQMKEWASDPWQTNLIHVQGIPVLAADYELWAQEALVKFCPQAYSPTVQSHVEDSFGFAHVKDSAWCGDGWSNNNILSTSAGDAEACASLAQGAKAPCFLLGAFFLRGTCATCTLTDAEVTDAQYIEWQSTKKNPECKFGSGWHSSMFYDFYAMEPAGVKDQKI